MHQNCGQCSPDPSVLSSIAKIRRPRQNKEEQGTYRCGDEEEDEAGEEEK